MVSSWNELTSTVSTSRSRSSSATSESGLPMLPQAMVRCPHAFSICASNSVVVVFPFVPVMAMTGHVHGAPTQLQLAHRLDVSRGKILRQRRDRIDARTQHDKIIRSRIVVRPRDRNGLPLPRARRFSIVDLSKVFSSALSRTVTSAPSLCSRRAAAVPLRPAPSTATFLPWYFTIYLSLSVANPSRAKMAERIQNRTITVFSFQPLSSK